MTRSRLERFRSAAETYLRELQTAELTELPLPQAHSRLVELAERWLPREFAVPTAAGALSRRRAE